jgi:hypothetical protein
MFSGAITDREDLLQGRAVRLVRGVTPVPLVLHFKRVALKFNVPMDLRPVPMKATNALERLVGRDCARELANLRSDDRVDNYRTSGECHRVQYANPDPIG